MLTDTETLLCQIKARGRMGKYGICCVPLYTDNCAMLYTVICVTNQRNPVVVVVDFFPPRIPVT